MPFNFCRRKLCETDPFCPCLQNVLSVIKLPRVKYSICYGFSLLLSFTRKEHIIENEKRMYICINVILMLLDFCSFPINFNIQQGETTVNSQQKIKGKQKLSHDQVAITNTYHRPVIILHFPYRSRPDSVFG